MCKEDIFPPATVRYLPTHPWRITGLMEGCFMNIAERLWYGNGKDLEGKMDYGSPV